MEYKPENMVFVQAGCYAQPSGWIRKAADAYPGCHAIIVEANQHQWPKIEQSIIDKGYGGRIELIKKACWDSNGMIEMYTGSGRKLTTVGASCVPDKWWVRRYEELTETMDVVCFDFAEWVLEHQNAGRLVNIVMDIEGAEYLIIPQMIKDGSLQKLGELHLEYHHHKMRNRDKYEALTRQIMEAWAARPQEQKAISKELKVMRGQVWA